VDGHRHFPEFGARDPERDHEGEGTRADINNDGAVWQAEVCVGEDRDQAIDVPGKEVPDVGREGAGRAEVIRGTVFAVGGQVLPELADINAKSCPVAGLEGGSLVDGFVEAVQEGQTLRGGGQRLQSPDR
jgi:hypothetical protein